MSATVGNGEHRHTPPTRFELREQRGETINNVGGNQNIFLPGKSIVLPSGSTGDLTREERAAAAIGLLLFWAGVAFLGLAVRATVGTILDAQHAGTLAAPYTHYVSGHWQLALGLIFAGMVVPRLGLRLFGRSAGPG